MKSTFLRLISLSAALASVASAGTHVGIGVSFGLPAPVVVRHAPPHRVVERVVVSPGPAPGPGYVWLPAHYSWNGQWVWVPGAWVMPPRSDARWVDGNWNPQTQQWIEGHWEVPSAAPVVAVPTPAPTIVVPSPAPVVAVTTDIVVPDAPPPPPEPEIRVAAPGPDHIWIAGYWGWENGRRQWFRGHWERPPHGYRVWVQPRWEHRPHGYVFVRGYWQ
jgi:hypothetical protein